jgi:two-component system, OmpR family, sensor kinase
LSRLPIRVRMTGAFALAMVLVLVAAGLFVYLRQRSDLDDTIDSALRSRSDDVAALIRQSGKRLAEDHGRRLAESRESFVQVLTPEGRLVDGTTGAHAAVLRPSEVKAAQRAPMVYERDVGPIDGPARMLARPVSEGGRSLVVITGTEIEDRHDALSGLLKSFLIGGPIAVLLASGMGYLLASAGFRPVEAMRQRAKRISLMRERERLPLPAARDEIRRLGETLNDMLGRLEASLERERRFGADAGHELRTPVAVAKTELEAALRTRDEEKIRLSLVAALEEMDHLAQLAEDLLLIARAGDGGLPVSRDEVGIRDLLERTQQRFADRAREQGRAILVDAPNGTRASVDPLRTRQALGNLVDNALRHGAGDIRVVARTDSEAVEIDVSDEGPGFPAELAPRAFERFARGGSARTLGGAGLGLAIVRAIAEAHGGTATIVDGPPGSTTVRIRIPFAPAQEEGPVPLSPVSGEAGMVEAIPDQRR